MSNCKVVIGTSAGGVETLSQLVQGLPKNFPATIFVVIHLPSFANAKSYLPEILARQGQLPVKHSQHGEAFQPGHIYVAPPNCHLLIEQGQLRLERSAKENGCRPAVDPLFRSAAENYGKQVIGVVLSGMLDDGTAGLLEIKKKGGIAIAQDPEDAMFRGMPQSAVDHVGLDYVVPLADLASLLVRLVEESDSENKSDLGASDLGADDQSLQELDITENTMTLSPSDGNPGSNPGSNPPPSGFICPECGGPLWEKHYKNFLQFRCRTGHTYSQETLLAEQAHGLEAALWSAIRVLEERMALLKRLSEKAGKYGRPLSVKLYEEKIQHLQQSTQLIQQSLQKTLEDELLPSNSRTSLSDSA